MSRLVVVSNRVPSPSASKSEAGGLSVALRELLEARSGVWFGWSGRVSDARGAVTTEHRDGVDYATIDLSEAEHTGFYNGFANAVLWPVLHTMPGLMTFRREDAETYRAVNERMAASLLPLLKADDTIWIQDYHLFHLPERLRARGVRNPIGFFLHIPFAPLAVTSVIPGVRQLIRGVLSADLIGFQTRDDMENFVEAACEIGDTERTGPDMLRSDGRPIRVGVFPVEIEARGFAALAAQSAMNAPVRRLDASLRGQHLVLGVDRLDPSKGLTERLRGFGRLLGRKADWARKATLLQIAAASRSDVAAYQALRQDLESVAGQVNAEFGEPDWVPVRLITRAAARANVAGFMRAARVGLVTPLRDGMNLVAKEFIAAQDPGDPGVLVLSRFAGAAHQLRDALLINPNDPDEIADAIERALRMDLGERQRRWQRQWNAIECKSASLWGADFLAALEHASLPPVRAPLHPSFLEAPSAIRLLRRVQPVRVENGTVG